MRKIRIEKVKSIESLEFDVPDKGVYVLTGSNGSGKTTLLAALHRIGYKNSFANNFKTTSNQERLDSFGESSISYYVGDMELSYNYRNTRWSPTPRKNSHILNDFGFPEVKFIAADSKRIEATQDELKPSRITHVDDHIKDNIKYILSDKKFDNLMYVNTKRGVGNRAYLISKKIKNKNFYYSEKNFSLGELCVLRLVTSLGEINDGSLVLIDEIEMALHPRAQIALFTYLNKVAEEKSLTVIFSTHSASLIKRTPKEKILLLENDGNGNVSCARNVYPAQALGSVAYDDEVSPDFLFFVEDYKAKTLLAKMIDKYKSIAFKNRMPPVFKIVPVGGFQSTIEFLSNSDQIFGDEVKRVAFLDKDVQDESIQEAVDNKKYKFLAKFQENEQKIKFLPCTPELGVINMISEDPYQHSLALKPYFENYSLDLERIVNSPEYNSISGDKPRKKAKKQFAYIISKISSRTGIKQDQCEVPFFEHYVNYQYQNTKELCEEMSSVFHKRS
ncbi:ATP-dependent endonuclease [Vibrio parahaemolyticus]